MLLKKNNYHEFLNKLKTWYEKNDVPVKKFEATIEYYSKKLDRLLVWSIATLLSSRTKDTTTNEAIKRLFDFLIEEKGEISEEKIESLIYPVGFYRVKAKKILNLLRKARELKKASTIEELMKFDGIGIKTAKIIASKVFNINTLAVDVHVKRITERIFGKRFKDEREINEWWKKIVGEKNLSQLNKLLVGLGQSICKAKNLNCGDCPIKKFCVVGNGKL